MTATEAAPLLELRGIHKSFGPVHALAGVNLEIPAGQVTALVGDNGAGKSVLIRTVSGIHAPDRGEILWEGQPRRIRTPREAADLGIETVYQDLALADNLDIVQNMFLGRERTHAFFLDIVQNMFLGRERTHALFLDEESMETSAGETLASLSVTTVRSVRQPVASLSGGQRQAVAIAKAVLWNSRLVIMDEPTAALGVTQTQGVLELVRRLADRGLAVMIVTHNLNDVFEVADRIAVLYLGHLVVQGPASGFDRERVVDFITSGRSDRTPDPERAPEPEPAP